MKNITYLISILLAIIVFYGLTSYLARGEQVSAIETSVIELNKTKTSSPKTINVAYTIEPNSNTAPPYFFMSVAQAQNAAEDIPSAENTYSLISPQIRAVLESTAVTEVQDWQHIGNQEQGFTVSTSRFHPETINPYNLTMLSLRSDYLVPGIVVAIFGMIILFALFTLINGSAKIEGGMSGKTLKRWGGFDIFIHWLCAIPCIFLILSGATLLTGKYLLEPNVGSLWASIIYYAKASHDIMVYPFIIGWLLICVKWLKSNVPSRADLNWFKVGGGYFNIGPLKHKHPDSGFVNAGEKIWYWTLAFAGVVAVISGLILMFPEALSVSRTVSLIALLLHAGSAIFIAAFSIVHIFMATLLAPGTFSAMTTGYVDHNWAKQHHNLWFDEVTSANKAK